MKEKKPSKFKQIEAQYKAKQEEEKAKIRQEQNKFKRFWKWVWYLISFPFKWIWVNIRDWRTALIFAIVVLVVGSEVWVPLLLGTIFGNKWLLGVAATCELFWLGPGTPFMVICIVITIAIKGVFNKIKEKYDGPRKIKKGDSTGSGNEN